MDEIGTVTRLESGLAVVNVEKKSACGSCKAGCNISETGAEIEAVNRVEAAVGQRVRVEMQPYLYIKGSILIYGVPALALILGAVIGKEYFSGVFKNYDPDIVSAVFGFSAFILSFAVVKLLSSRLEKDTGYKPVVVEIIKEAEIANEVKTG